MINSNWQKQDEHRLPTLKKRNQEEWDKGLKKLGTSPSYSSIFPYLLSLVWYSFKHSSNLSLVKSGQYVGVKMNSEYANWYKR